MDPDPYPNPSDPVLAPGLFCPGAYVKSLSLVIVQIRFLDAHYGHQTQFPYHFQVFENLMQYK